MKTISALKYLLILFLFFGMGCEKTFFEQGFAIGQEANFRPNLVYTAADGKYTLKITEISDSRCPEGVVCIWSGEVTIKGEWTTNGNKSAFEVHSVVSQQDKMPAGISLKIVDAKPYPKFGIEPKPDDIAVTLLIQKN